MSSKSFTSFTRGLAVVAVTTLVQGAALASESSCPAPCTTPPKSALFVREQGMLNGYGYATALNGTLRRGSAKTVLRLDVTASIQLAAPMPRFLVSPSLNGVDAVPMIDLHGNACDQTKSPFCSVGGSFWWDIDALEAAHPGQFVGQPLDITVLGGTFLGGGGAGSPYVFSFSAQVVKKK